MDEEQKEYFRNDKNCSFEIMEARKAFTNETTVEQFENLIKGLMIMSLYCSEEMTSLVSATIFETQQRQIYASTKEFLQ